MSDVSGEALAELRSAFAEEARRRLDALERGLEGEGAGVELELHAHTLRGSAAVVELGEAERLAAELEGALAADRGRARKLVARLRETVEALPVVPSGASAPAGGEHVVLYVEDDGPNALLVQRMLAQRPAVTMLDARTGAEGLRIARERLPALVLLDLRLPDMHGLDVVAALRADPATARLPLAVVTGGAPSAVLDELEAAGVEEILAKPFDAGRLLSVVDRALAA